MARITEENGKTLVYITEARLDNITTSDFQKQMDAMLETYPRDITIDCTELQYMSSAGLRTFLILEKTLQGTDGKLVLKNLNRLVKDVFEITGMNNIITIED